MTDTLPIPRPARARRLWTPAVVAAMVLSTAAPCAAKVTQFSLEQLMELEITSVSKKPEPFFTAPSAIFVIGQEDIRRSGATSVQELLGMVPGMEVSRIDNNKWAITSRGFNGRFSNKLLVLLDGRTIYSPSFSGVFWEEQDMMLEDLDRVEVIRGPGGTLWGANAVNGVINIISKKAADTQGTLVSAGLGSEEGSAAVRHGVKLGENAWLRLYAKETNRDGAAEYPSAADLQDDANMGKTGFRLDWDKDAQDRFTLQGDAHRGQYTERANHIDLANPANNYLTTVNDGSDLRGANLIGRWHRGLGEGSDMTLQAYFDHDRRSGDTITQATNTADLDFQHHFALGQRHDILWGLGYRHNTTGISNHQPLQIAFTPDARTTELFSAFLQDEITLIPERLRCTVGAKFEHNDYTGYEVQPNARLTWTPSPEHTLWAAVSRAVRTPASAETDIQVGLFAQQIGPSKYLFTVEGPGTLAAETLLAYEIGYRLKPEEHLFFDLTAFANHYDHLLTLESGTPRNMGAYWVIPSVFANNMDGETYGIELATTWQPVAWWQLKAAVSHLEIQLHTKPGSTDTTSEGYDEKGNPQNQLSLRSLVNLPHNLELDAWLRYVDSVPRPNGYTSSLGVSVDSYVSLDLRLGWRPSENLELSLVGKNLLDPDHLEYVSEDSIPVEIERSVYGKATWSF